ncbi:hypothetical protein F4V91_32370 [Neorhizobium galegae]|uniref:Uncharacterized protein n=1 Tax=Neorhizobium galegae TaxID=399 RepID=A0A6A1TFE3_NEOGA|nr:hypothetical protein [Neorhizobium galegae]KAB1082358.1 hypothetical protein F4V91_32370 [Neorhizobium galegae]
MLCGTFTARELHELPTPPAGLKIFDHPLMVSRTVVGETGWIFIVAEKLADISFDVSTVEDAYALFQVFDGEILMVEAQVSEYGFNCRVLSNGNGVAPIYFHQSADKLILDWDIDRLAKSVEHKSIDFQYLCRSLIDPVYTHRTPFSNIHLLPPRVELRWDGARVRLTVMEAEAADLEIGEESAGAFLVDYASRMLRRRAVGFHAELSRFFHREVSHL